MAEKKKFVDIEFGADVFTIPNEKGYFVKLKAGPFCLTPVALEVFKWSSTFSFYSDTKKVKSLPFAPLKEYEVVGKIEQSR